MLEKTLLTKTVKGAFIGAVSLFLSGCALVPGLHVTVPVPEPAREADSLKYEVVAVTPDLILQQATRSSSATEETGLDMSIASADTRLAPTEYKIGPGDILQVVVWDHPELTNPTGSNVQNPESTGHLVATDGTAFYPYVGRFDAAGKTVREVREHLSGSLKHVIASPQVDVRVLSYRSQRVQVTGEVKSPGAVVLNDTVKGFLEALNERGGLTENASNRSALLVRDGRPYRVDLSGLISGARPAVNPLLMAGDIIHVPDTSDEQIFMLGEVDRQGSLPLRQAQMSLTEALTKAGGLSRTTSNDAGVLVFRRPSALDKAATVFLVDMSAPEGLLIAGEFRLEPRDVVIVSATKFSQYNLIINQFLPTVSTVFQLDRLVRSFE